MEPMSKDPAEGNALMRLFYRDWRPTRLGRIANAVSGWYAAAGFPPHRQVALETTGRRSGRQRTQPVVIAESGGQRYLVSMLGHGSGWVKNVRANPEAVLRHGRREPVTLVEVPAGERAPILKEYTRVATSGRTHFPVEPDAAIEEFEAIAEDYPVFRIEAREAVEQ
jgi:deazaflavin-dependent oxidoreductase (nitroreductase family)